MAVNKVAWCYEFGPFVFDPEARVVSRHGQMIALAPKALETLLVLVSDAGRILEKDELLSRIWPDCFVEEGNLSQAVFQLRKALGESGSKQQYIETIPRRGYRFVAPVRLVPKDDPVSTLNFDDLSADFALPDSPSDPAADSGAFDPASDSVSDSSAPSAVAPGSRRSRFIRIAVGAIVPAMLAGAVYFLTSTAKLAPRVSFETMRFEKLTSSGRASRPALSPDGHYAAYVVDDGPRQSLQLHQLVSSSVVALVAPAEVEYRGVTFSRRGLFVYYVQAGRGSPLGTLYRIPLIGGTPQKLLADVDGPVTFSPDDRQLAFVRRDPARRESLLMIAEADGGNPRPLVTHRMPSRIAPDGPAWSPDGAVIAYAAAGGPQGNEGMRIMAARVADGSERQIGTENPDWIGQVAWTRDGRGIIFETWQRAVPVFSDQLWLLSYPDGEVSRVTNDLISYNRVSTAATTSLLAAERSERDSQLWIERIGPHGKVGADEAGNPARRLRAGFSEHFGEYFGLSWTPDGRILYGSQSSGNLDVWVMNADGGEARRLTTGPESESQPQATSDGRYIVFVAGRAGNNHIWRIDGDGGNPKQLTSGKHEYSPSLSPDARFVVYISVVEGRGRLLKVPIEGGAPIPLTDRNTAMPIVSPDGRSILCLMVPEGGGPFRPTLVPFDGGQPQHLSWEVKPDPGQWQWTPDSRAVILTQTRDGASNLWRQPIDGGRPTPLTGFKEDLIFRFAFSPDGRTLAFERGRGLKDIVLLRDFD